MVQVLPDCCPVAVVEVLPDCCPVAVVEVLPDCCPVAVVEVLLDCCAVAVVVYAREVITSSKWPSPRVQQLYEQCHQTLMDRLRREYKQS